MSNASVGHEQGCQRHRGETTSCPVCKVLFTATRKTQACCSRGCYLIYWAAMKFFDALQAGKAEGLRAQLEALSGKHEHH
jgi:hypothetical protein